MIFAGNPSMYLYIIDDIIPAYYPHTNSIRVQFITGLTVRVLLNLIIYYFVQHIRLQYDINFKLNIDIKGINHIILLFP